MTEAVVVSTARTGLARSWKGALNMTHAATLGGHVIRHAVQRARLEPGEVEDVLLGCALPEGAVPKLLERAALRVQDIGLWELNEAFAVQVAAAGNADRSAVSRPIRIAGQCNASSGMTCTTVCSKAAIERTNAAVSNKCTSTGSFGLEVQSGQFEISQ